MANGSHAAGDHGNGDLAMSAMVPAVLPTATSTALVAADGRPSPAFRDQLRVIPSARNAMSVLVLWVQIIATLVAAVKLDKWLWPVVFVLMGRTFAQLTSLMHEAAHRLLFANRRLNDFAGRWLLGYPSFTPTDAYRRVHMAHHREEFGPNEPDIALYAGYPVGAASFRRKLWRDLSGRTGWKLMLAMLRGLRSADSRVRRTIWSIVATQAALAAAMTVLGAWWLYPAFWLLPYLTVWRVINRLRSIAEHGGLRASDDRRETTHSVRQHLAGRMMIAPYRIGWHLAHHVDSGIPFRNLPRFHAALHDANYVNDTIEYPSYTSLWVALRGARRAERSVVDA